MSMANGSLSLENDWLRQFVSDEQNPLHRKTLKNRLLPRALAFNRPV